MRNGVYPFVFMLLYSPMSFGQELPYIDNRSDAAQLVESLYNAVNRKEYGRAWSYFGDAKPSSSFAAFSDGYAQTKEIAVETGAVSEEGAAGSTYFQVPVAILAYGQDGSDKVFAGCYTLRLANPQIQGEDFRPMHIEKGALKPVSTEFEASAPESCGDGPPPAPRDAAMEAAKRQFAANDAKNCGTANPVNNEPAYPIDRYEISYRAKFDAETGPERKVVLLRFFCMSGAYNEQHLYYAYSDGEGLQQVSFAEPSFEAKYSGDDDTSVELIKVDGLTSRLVLVNSAYDPATKTITEHSLWRGLGDASTTAKWVFRDGNFVLTSYDVDASYDGEINPKTIYRSEP